jgi:hypothetical protein
MFKRLQKYLISWLTKPQFLEQYFGYSIGFQLLNAINRSFYYTVARRAYTRRPQKRNLHKLIMLSMKFYSQLCNYCALGFHILCTKENRIKVLRYNKAISFFLGGGTLYILNGLGRVFLYHKNCSIGNDTIHYCVNIWGNNIQLQKEHP